jgi:hypothetical protein
MENALLANCFGSLHKFEWSQMSECWISSIRVEWKSRWKMSVEVSARPDPNAQPFARRQWIRGIATIRDDTESSGMIPVCLYTGTSQQEIVQARTFLGSLVPPPLAGVSSLLYSDMRDSELLNVDDATNDQEFGRAIHEAGLDHPEGIGKLCELTHISLWPGLGVAALCFECIWDREHGRAVFLRGASIVGIGGSGDSPLDVDIGTKTTVES